MAKETKPETAEQPRGIEVARRYFDEIAQVFVQPLQGQGQLRSFTTNSAVLGDYAEAWIRELAVKMLPSLRVSTGTMVRPTDRRESAMRTPQIDILIWDPSWMPAVFECGDFAVVHIQSVRGIIEVKRSLKVSDMEKFRDALRIRRSRVLHESRANVLGVVLAGGFRSDRTLLDWKPADEMDCPDQLPVVRLLDRKYQRADSDGVHSLITLLRRIARTGDPKVL